MKLRMILAILAGKSARLALRCLRRQASSFPGVVALRLCPDLLGRLRLPEKIVAVTGSNGKTSTTAMIDAAARAAGLQVLCNREGSNQIEGVTTLFLRHCTLGGRVKGEVAILESDERFCQYTFRYFAPQYLLVTNLYRDQLTRNGHSDFVAGELKKGLPAESCLILNADEPVSAALGAGRRAIYFGVDAGVFSEPADEELPADDGAVCPLCCAPMRYESRLAAHLGVYACTDCGFKRPACAHRLSGRDEAGRFVLDRRYAVRPQQDNLVFAGNLTAAFTVCTEALGIDPAAAAAALDGYQLENQRLEAFTLAGHPGLMTLTKHENSMAYRVALHDAAAGTEAVTLVLIFDQLSRKYEANDISWLWDIDFRPAAQSPAVRRVILGGQFAHDLAVRLLADGVAEEILSVCPDLDEMMQTLRTQAEGDIRVMTCFTDMPKFRRRLGEVSR